MYIGLVCTILGSKIVHLSGQLQTAQTVISLILQVLCKHSCMCHATFSQQMEVGISSGFQVYLCKLYSTLHVYSSCQLLTEPAMHLGNINKGQACLQLKSHMVLVQASSELSEVIWPALARWLLPSQQFNSSQLSGCQPIIIKSAVNSSTHSLVQLNPPICY